MTIAQTEARGMFLALVNWGKTNNYTGVQEVTLEELSAVLQIATHKVDSILRLQSWYVGDSLREFIRIANPTPTSKTYWSWKSSYRSYKLNWAGIYHAWTKFSVGNKSSMEKRVVELRGLLKVEQPSLGSASLAALAELSENGSVVVNAEIFSDLRQFAGLVD